MARTGIRATALITRDSKVLLIHRRKNGEEYWVFPGGGVEEGETWEQALVREVKEELNLEVLNHELAFMDLNSKDGNEHPYYFCKVSEGTAEIVGEEKDRNSPENFYELVWIPVSELEHMNLVPPTAKEKFLSYLQNHKDRD